MRTFRHGKSLHIVCWIEGQNVSTLCEGKFPKSRQQIGTRKWYNFSTIIATTRHTSALGHGPRKISPTFYLVNFFSVTTPTCNNEVGFLCNRTPSVRILHISCSNKRCAGMSLYIHKYFLVRYHYLRFSRKKWPYFDKIRLCKYL